MELKPGFESTSRRSTSRTNRVDRALPRKKNIGMAQRYPTIPLTPIESGPRAEQDEELYEVRKKIHPRAVHGWFAGWRVAFVILTQLVFYGLPWLTWNKCWRGRVSAGH